MFSCMYCVLVHVHGKQSHHIDKGSSFYVAEEGKGVV